MTCFVKDWLDFSPQKIQSSQKEQLQVCNLMTKIIISSFPKEAGGFQTPTNDPVVQRLLFSGPHAACAEQRSLSGAGLRAGPGALGCYPMTGEKPTYNGAPVKFQNLLGAFLLITPCTRTWVFAMKI